MIDSITERFSLSKLLMKRKKVSKTVTNKKLSNKDELTKANERIKDKYCNSCILI